MLRSSQIVLAKFRLRTALQWVTWSTQVMYRHWQGYVSNLSFFRIWFGCKDTVIMASLCLLIIDRAYKLSWGSTWDRGLDLGVMHFHQVGCATRCCPREMKLVITSVRSPNELQRLWFFESPAVTQKDATCGASSLVQGLFGLFKIEC